MSHPPASGTWINPPAPGTADNQHCYRRDKVVNPSYKRFSREDAKRYAHSTEGSDTRSRSRSCSHSRDHHSKRSHKHHRRSRSRDYRKRRSRSRSRSPHRRSKKHKLVRRKHSRSRSKSHTRRHRRSCSRSQSDSSHKKRSRSNSWTSSTGSDKDSMHHNGLNTFKEVPKNQDYIRKAYLRKEEVPAQENSFKNDGSFLEMFKKMQEEKAAEEKKENDEDQTSEIKKPTPVFGKRRGGRVLKTGLVQKHKNPDEDGEEPKDAWSIYMKEVKRYKEACCDDDSKTRPLVK